MDRASLASALNELSPGETIDLIANHSLVYCASAELRYVVGSLLAAETEAPERALMQIRAIWSEYRLQLSDLVQVLNSNNDCVANFSVADALDH
jgi:hypothetical protein